MSKRSDEIGRVAVLDDPLRRRLYEFVRLRGKPVSRDDAARAAGIGRTLAAYHLDKLADEGFLTTSYARPEGRSGPGAGRPSKLYEPAAEEVAVSVPARDYEFAAHLFASAAEAGRSVRDEARHSGRELGASSSRRSLKRALTDRGYEPFEDEEGRLRLRNCPFHRLAQEHRDVVCGMNEAFLQGLLEGLGADDVRASLDPRPGLCCVAISSADNRG
jgi:predicted ArsR family transcriptional regulator